MRQMKSPLDTLDRQLVELLQANGRSSMQELSNKTGLSRSAVFTRVRRLEHDGVITGYAAQTSRRALGMQIRAFCNVQLKQHDARFLKEFEANIGDFKEVQSCYHIAGAFDYLIAVDVPDMDAYHEFIARKLAAQNAGARGGERQTAAQRLAAEQQKQRQEKKKSKAEQREDLCELLGRGC